MGGLDWRALLSQPAAATVVVKKSPFEVKKRDAAVGAGQGDTTPASSKAADAQQADTSEQPESVVPIMLLKAPMRQHPVERYVLISSKRSTAVLCYMQKWRTAATAQLFVIFT
jgi:hypothetical protein